MPRVSGGNAPQQPRPVSYQPARNTTAPAANTQTPTKTRNVQTAPPAPNTGRRVNIIV